MGTDAEAATVDILEALLSAPPAESPAASEAFPDPSCLARLLRPAPAPRPAKPRLVPASAAPAPPPAARARAKRKATHYFEETVAARLDAARDALTGRGPGRVTKSGIVEAALALALDAYEAEGQDSPLCRRLGRTAVAGRHRT
ncbi:hypothetical protein [Solidesulfovibrio sp.]|uniref:hypothetical protein n=1 Tax=Solidesulfovibrio sp. TaxID=2910990 RepID=UPI00261B6BDF|nr:hypothetical protein [Solidesulfovibrio sp.]